jgi:hypothetical protein
MASVNVDCVRLTDGRQILRSYGTVVAGFFPKEKNPWKRTKNFYSVTTTRHVNQWLGERRDVGTASKAVWVDHKELLKLAEPIESRQ